jgi:hypothetical protein
MRAILLREGYYTYMARLVVIWVFLVSVGCQLDLDFNGLVFTGPKTEKGVHGFILKSQIPFLLEGLIPS